MVSFKKAHNYAIHRLSCSRVKLLEMVIQESDSRMYWEANAPAAFVPMIYIISCKCGTPSSVLIHTGHGRHQPHLNILTVPLEK